MADRLSKLEKAYRQNPESPHFARLADQYLSRGMIFRALDICEEGCERFPDYTTGFLVLSKCYEAREDFEAARKAMGRALRLDSENPGGFKRLSKIYQNLGNSELALKSLEQAVRLDPLDKQAGEQIDQLTHATWADSMEAAEETFDELPQESPEDIRETAEHSPSGEIEAAEVRAEIDAGPSEPPSPAPATISEEEPSPEPEEKPEIDDAEESFLDDEATPIDGEIETEEEERDLDLEQEPVEETSFVEEDEEEPDLESEEVSFISEYGEEFAQDSEEEPDEEGAGIEPKEEQEQEPEEEDLEAKAELVEEPVPETIEDLSTEAEEPPTEEIVEEPASIEEEPFVEPEPEPALDTIEELSIEVEEPTPDKVTEEPVSIEEEREGQEEEAPSGEIADLGAIAGFTDEQEESAPPSAIADPPPEEAPPAISEDEEDLSSLGAEVFDEPSPPLEPIEPAPAAPPPLEQTEEAESVSDLNTEMEKETVETVEEEEGDKEVSDLQEIAATLETEHREAEAELESPVPPSRKPREGSVSNVSGLGPRDDDELLRMFQEIEAEQTKELGEEEAPPPSQIPSVAASDSPAEEDADRQIATVTLAEIYTIQGLTQRAIDTYEQILEQDPGNEVIRNKLADLKKTNK